MPFYFEHNNEVMSKIKYRLNNPSEINLLMEMIEKDIKKPTKAELEELDKMIATHDFP